jgi:hypothetical protein
MSSSSHSSRRASSVAPVPSRDEVSRLLRQAALPHSADAGELLIANLDETALLGCVGAPAAHLDASEVTLVSVLLDASGSMQPYRSAVVEAHRGMVNALAASKTAADVLLSTWAFADAPLLLRSHEPVARAVALASGEYAPAGCTALHDTVLHAMTGLVAYSEALAASGVPTKRVLFVLSDGADNASRARASEVKRVARELLSDESSTLAFAGFGPCDARALADSLGFGDVIGAQATASELRRVFRQVSQSVVRVSQAANAAGGFF